MGPYFVKRGKPTKQQFKEKANESFQETSLLHANEPFEPRNTSHK
jgi:hypothetical protein